MYELTSIIIIKVRPPPEGKEDDDIKELPMTNTELLRLNQNITAWEREEVQHYDKIYFHGPKARKIEASKGQPYNNGFDDESGSYIKVLNDHLMYRYEVLEVIGKVFICLYILRVQIKLTSLAPSSHSNTEFSI